RGAQVHVGIDEGGCQHEPVRLDDAVPVRLHGLAELGDDALVDPDAELRVDARDWVENPGAAQDEVLGSPLADVEHRHHATSPATAASTATGPCVSRS